MCFSSTGNAALAAAEAQVQQTPFAAADGYDWETAGFPKDTEVKQQQMQALASMVAAEKDAALKSEMDAHETAIHNTWLNLTSGWLKRLVTSDVSSKSTARADVRQCHSLRRIYPALAQVQPIQSVPLEILAAIFQSLGYHSEIQRVILHVMSDVWESPLMVVILMMCCRSCTEAVLSGVPLLLDPGLLPLPYLSYQHRRIAGG